MFDGRLVIDVLHRFDHRFLRHDELGRAGSEVSIGKRRLSPFLRMACLLLLTGESRAVGQPSIGALRSWTEVRAADLDHARKYQGCVWVSLDVGSGYEYGKEMS